MAWIKTHWNLITYWARINKLFFLIYRQLQILDCDWLAAVDDTYNVLIDSHTDVQIWVEESDGHEKDKETQKNCNQKVELTAVTVEWTKSQLKNTNN